MLKTYLKIAFSGYSPERFLNMCKHKEIEIWGLEVKENEYECMIRVKDFRRIKPLVRKAKIRIRVIERHGISFLFFQYRKRKPFFWGILFCCIMIYSMTFFIWNIEIQGNESITSDVLLEYLKMNEIYQGMPAFKVNCEQICTLLRKDFSDIIWVSTSLEGTKLKIVVKENTDTMKMEKTEEAYHDIVSNVEGTITKIITRKGSPKVAVGDSVQIGDVLVSGTIEMINDMGEVVREEQVNADADIFVKRTISYQDTCADTHFIKEYYKTKKRILFVNIFSYQFELGIHKKEGNHEVRTIYRQSEMLPLSWGESISREYELEEISYEEKEQKEMLKETYEMYQKELSQQGIEIVAEKLSFQKEEAHMLYQGTLEVIQQIVDFY